MPELYPLGGEHPSTEVQKWADVAMWKAPKHDDPQRPKVTVSVCTPDPLGVMAMVNGQYTGKVYRFPHEVSDDERREAWEAGAVSLLSKAPLEWVQMSISFENVSRAFTHQLVRTRMAGYAQESQRFAVKTDMGDAVKLPPSLAGTMPWKEFEEQCAREGIDPEVNRSPKQYWRQLWDGALSNINSVYGVLVNTGMPAEDARGLLPTNTLTRVHMHIDMGTLLRLAGSRLCTQAQAEWRAVFAELAKAIRNYGPDEHRWQMDLIASSFRPVCWAEGKCPMKAKSDRFCEIRADVDRLEAEGVPSSEWDDVIHPARWIASDAARVAPGQTR